MDISNKVYGRKGRNHSEEYWESQKADLRRFQTSL